MEEQKPPPFTLIGAVLFVGSLGLWGFGFYAAIEEVFFALPRDIWMVHILVPLTTFVAFLFFAIRAVLLRFKVAVFRGDLEEASERDANLTDV